MRVVTNEDIKKYMPMVDSYIRKSVLKNWNEASLNKNKRDISLGNTGMTINDIRQYLLLEVCIGLQKYNVNYRTEDGASVKESTFIFTHIFNRGGQLLKRLCKRRAGYGIWTNQFESVIGDINEEV
jgi:hypothetical protein